MSPRGLFLLVLFALTLIGGGSHAPRADAADLNVLVVDDPADDAEAGAPEIPRSRSRTTRRETWSGFASG